MTPSLLQRLTVQTLEEVAFVFAFANAEDPEWRGDLVAASLDFSVVGGPTGTLRLAAPRSFGRLLASNLLAIDEDDPALEQAGLDATGELLNILMGVYAEARFGKGVSCNFTPPTVCTHCAHDCAAMRAGAAERAVLITEEGDAIEILVEERP